MRQLILNGIWNINQRGKEKQYDVKVPGSVLSALLEAEAIPDPFDGRNEYLVREIFRNDYIFQRDFHVSEELLKEENIELVCEGLDTLAVIYINDKKVFYAENMHRTWRIPIKEYIEPGINNIRIEFLSVLNFIDNYVYKENKEVKYVAAGAMKGNQLVRKAHSMFGWDWGPQLPDAGIFRDIYLECWTGRRITDIEFLQHHKQAEAELQIKTVFSCTGTLCENQKLKVVISDKQTGETVAYKEDNLGSVLQCENTFTVKNPKLWWPNGYGQQPLYEVVISLLDIDENVLQEQKKTIGFRTLEVSREKDSFGKEFAFKINGIKIFAMGANYIPEDCVYSRITKERQDYLLECAKRANFNCVRVWGGGYYPSDTFYELCDEKGIIVWQDLMFACNVYDATESFLENCKKEVEDNVKRLRHHPSLGLWCGNNEIESAWSHWPDFQTETLNLKADYIKLFEHVIPEVMRKNAKDTFFWPSSPSSGGCFANPDDENNGDAHYWDVWHGQKPFTDYKKYFFRFCSEFGFQSFPDIKTIESFTKPEDRNIFSRVMESHQKNDAANGKILYYMSENFRYPAKFDDLIYISQVLQGMAVQYGVEHWRRNRGRCMGTLYWQLNDNWPVASWSSIDYFGRWKALQYMATKFYARKTSSLIKDNHNIHLFVENETAEKVKWKAIIRLKDMDCKIISEVIKEGNTESFCSKEAIEMDLEKFCLNEYDTWEEKVFVESSVIFEDGTSTHNVEVLLPYKYMALKKPVIEKSAEETKDTFILRLKSNTFAPFIELKFEDADVIFSDNYFHLTGDVYEVEIKKQDILKGKFNSTDDLLQKLQVRTVADTY